MWKAVGSGTKRFQVINQGKFLERWATALSQQPAPTDHAGIWRAATHRAQGRILLHRDYWDAAEELYEKIPLVGALMRWLKTRANA